MTFVVGQVVTADQLNNLDIESMTGAVIDRGGQVFNITASYDGGVTPGAATGGGMAARNTLAIMAAFDAAKAAGGGTVLVPPGTYRHNEITIDSTYGYCVLYLSAGARMLYQPLTAVGGMYTAWSFSGVDNAGILGSGYLYSEDTTLTKTALHLTDVDRFRMEGLALGFAGNNWISATNDAIGLRTDGHAFTSADQFHVFADRPLVHGGNGVGNGNDVHSFRNTLLHALSANPVIEVLAGGGVGSYVFDGTNDWAGGSDGFKCVINNGSLAGLMSFTNLRWEQPATSTGWFFDIQASASTIQMLSFNNVSYGAPVQAGNAFRFRRVAFVTIKDFRGDAVGAKTVLDIDSTVTGGVTLENFITGSTTHVFTTTGHSLVVDVSNADQSHVVQRLYQPTTMKLPVLMTDSIGLGGAAGTTKTLTMYGTTSGSVTLAVAAIAGSNTLTLPAGTTDFSATGGASQVVKQTSAGGAFTVATVGVSDLAGLGTNVGTWLATPSSANLRAALTDETGGGAAVFAETPTLVTPILGTPTSGTLTNCTGLPISGIAGLGTGVGTALGINVGSIGAFVVNGGALGTPSSGTLTNATGLPIATGVAGLGSNVATFLGSPSSANLAAAVTGETGTGALVFDTDPTFSNAIGVGNYIQGQEVSEPSNPPSDQWRLYTVDSSGKTQLRVRFGTGGGIAIATEA